MKNLERKKHHLETLVVVNNQIRTYTGEYNLQVDDHETAALQLNIKQRYRNEARGPFATL